MKRVSERGGRGPPPLPSVANVRSCFEKGSPLKKSRCSSAAAVAGRSEGISGDQDGRNLPSGLGRRQRGPRAGVEQHPTQGSLGFWLVKWQVKIRRVDTSWGGNDKGRTPRGHVINWGGRKVPGGAVRPEEGLSCTGTGRCQESSLGRKPAFFKKNPAVRKPPKDNPGKKEQEGTPRPP